MVIGVDPFLGLVQSCASKFGRIGKILKDILRMISIRDVARGLTHLERSMDSSEGVFLNCNAVWSFLWTIPLLVLSHL